MIGKSCDTCNLALPIGNFHKDGRMRDGYYATCKKCWHLKGIEWANNHKDRVKVYQRRYSLKRKYGIALEEYEKRLAAQGGVCAICKTDKRSRDIRTNNGRMFPIDHNHKTGKVRGILCSKCNVAMERMDSIEDWGILARRYKEKFDEILI